MRERGTHEQGAFAGGKTARPPRGNHMNLTLGTEGEEVQRLQRQLAERGYDVGEVDGRYGPRTRDAVAAFQEEHGLTPDGTVGSRIAEEFDLDIDVPEVEEERAKFKQLLSKNPNYFGNRPELDAEPVTDVTADTSYEEVTCVGYDPGASQLEAVVSLKRDVGYGGDVCTEGSIEYVRFFLDRERNGSWTDVGVASTRVYDMPGQKPVDYAVSVELDQPLEPCDSAVLPRVRAILSWEVEPPAGKPRHRPVWGNRHEADIQLETRPPTVGDVIDETLINPEMLDGMDAEASAPFDPPALTPDQLLVKYDGTSVPPHRGGFDKFKQLLSGPLPPEASTPFPVGPLDPNEPSPPGPIPDPLPGPAPEPAPAPIPEPSPEPIPGQGFDLPPELDIDIEEVVDDLFETTGNTGYEELDCVGFRSGILTGLLTIKRPSGYSGGLCTVGSQEYVAFWAKPVGGGSWTHVGTASVTVHDIPGLPEDGLQYAVHLPADLSHHRTPCHRGPSLVKVRAVMAWNRKPPSSDPNFTPTWGNRVETVVQVPPGPDPGEGLLEVGTIGNVLPTDIEQTTGADATGTASGPLVSSGGSVRATTAPFGGRVTITGRPEGFSPSASGANSLKYRISVKPHDAPPSAYRPLTNEPKVATYANPGTFQKLTVDGDGFYTYLPGVKQNILAVWRTTDDGVYDLKIEAKRGDGRSVDAAAIAYPDGTTTDEMVIHLDNTGPEATVDITGVMRDGTPPTEAAGECDFLNVGDTIVGTFTAEDKHLRRYNLGVNPNGPAEDARVLETSRPTVQSRGGGTGDWELKTKWSKDEDVTRPAGQMDTCGYTVHVHVVDNAIVNNNYSGHNSHDSEGFCLLGAGEEVVGGDDEESDGGEGGAESNGDDGDESDETSSSGGSAASGSGSSGG